MRCEECLALVEDYFDGELDDRTSVVVARHLDECRACASASLKMEREREFYLRYRCDVQPSPEFWDRVMARVARADSDRLVRPLAHLKRWFGDLPANFRTPRFSPSLTALLLLAAIGATAVVMRYISSHERTGARANISQNQVQPGTSLSPSSVKPMSQVSPSPIKEEGEKRSDTGASESSHLGQGGAGRDSLALMRRRDGAGRNFQPSRFSARQQTPAQLVREAEQKYLAAIELLSRDVNSHRSQLGSETIARFEQTLAAVDRTIAETRRAVHEHPDDPVAAQYMMAAYARKIDVLREIASF